MNVLSCLWKQHPQTNLRFSAHIITNLALNVKGSEMCVIIGNHLLYFQTIRERKIENKIIGGKKKVYSVFTQYICFVCVNVFVLSVGALQTSSFNIGGWHFNTDTSMWISQNGIFYFFQCLIFFGVIPLFHFLKLFSLFQGCK